ncbi:beta-ketoacyl-[acyl-carrier-protein] synthase family protein [Thermodesulfobacteriota bacterium]
MTLKRVVITGVGAITGLGDDVSDMLEGMEQGRSGVRRMDGWERYTGLRSLVGAPAELKNEKKIPRKSRRSMGRMGIFAVQAADQAIKDASFDTEQLCSGRVGCIIGSTMGGPEALNDSFEIMLPERDLSKLSSMKFFQCVSHTASMNVAQYLGISGCVMATSAACASGLQAIGTGYDLVRIGRQDAVLCGGSEEIHPTVTGSFDILFAASTGYNDTPEKTPRPFDSRRDGLVCGEGSGIVLLEEYEHARARGADMYAEIIGYNTCGSGTHISQSNRDAMIKCLRAALDDACISREEVDYISAHATATLQGDAEEAEAVKEVFGSSIAVSSLKGYIGHTMGASGAIELIAALHMMRKGVIYPTLNLEEVGPDCRGIQHVTELERRTIDTIVKNCFAFGGINASLVCRKVERVGQK